MTNSENVHVFVSADPVQYVDQRITLADSKGTSNATTVWHIAGGSIFQR